LRREILRHLLIADGGEKAALFTIQGATGRRIAHALQHQMQQHTLELLRRLLETGLRILPQSAPQIAGSGGVEDQTTGCQINRVHESFLTMQVASLR
jgi:hypothetical protein